MADPLGPRVRSQTSAGNTLLDLLAELDAMPENPDWPADGAANYKHYLYGLPKRS